MAREFIMPGRIVTGENALQLAESNLKELGKKALLVTDEGQHKPCRSDCAIGEGLAG